MKGVDSAACCFVEFSVPADSVIGSDFSGVYCFFHSRFLLLSLFSCRVVSDSATPWTVAHQAPLSMGFPRQENWRGLLFPPPGDLPTPGIEPECPALVGGFLQTLSHPHILGMAVYGFC